MTRDDRTAATPLDLHCPSNQLPRCYPRPVTPTTETDPACPEAPPAAPRLDRRTLTAEYRPFASVHPATWDRLAAANPHATPFARWAFHRAWWDAYGENAHEQTIVVLDPADRAPVAIAPLMHRHEVEPSDARTRTRLRHAAEPALTPVVPTAKAVFFGASYHADYATLLGAPADLPGVADAVVERLCSPPGPEDPHPRPWDVVDLRRLRCADPALPALEAAFRRHAGADDWEIVREREDVCPVVTLPVGGSFDDYLATLGKHARHEVRRKLRRAREAGTVAFVESSDPLADLDAFIELHQRRWGVEGLFPPTEGGRQSRLFFRRLFELFGPDGPARLAVLSIGGRRVAAGIHYDDGETHYLYNAGIDPAARALSPGVVMGAEYVALALRLGRRRLDYLRGAEPYKYEWGARDEPIERLLVRRRVA